MSLFALSAPQRVGVAVVLVMIAGWVVYLFSSARRTYDPGSELELAPNRKEYFQDEVLEGSRLTKFLWWAFAMLAISAIGLPVYWLREPFRQKGAGFDRGTKYFDEESVSRGQDMFEASPGSRPGHDRQPHFGCETCHGAKGIGGGARYSLTDPVNPAAPVRQVQWAAPALNTVLLRYRPDEVKFIITYGRAQTPMPPWGVNGGGALNDQQIDDLVNYLQSIQLPASKVVADDVAQYGTDGQKLFDGFCARCHTHGFSYGEPGPPGGGAFGPAISAGATLRQFPDPATQIEWVTKTAEIGKPYGVRGISKGVMPHFSDMLTADQIKAIVDYERTL